MPWPCKLPVTLSLLCVCNNNISRRPIDEQNDWNRVACDIRTGTNSFFQMLESMRLQQQILSNLQKANILQEKNLLQEAKLLQEGITISSKLKGVIYNLLCC